jgi:hypothetical protein
VAEEGDGDLVDALGSVMPEYLDPQLPNQPGQAYPGKEK